MRPYTPRPLKQQWAKAMLELLASPGNEVDIKKVLRVLGVNGNAQGVLNV